MIVLCQLNQFFEDQLTEGKQYEVLRSGLNDYYLLNDKGEKRWYGRIMFRPLTVEAE